MGANYVLIPGWIVGLLPPKLCLGSDSMDVRTFDAPGEHGGWVVAFCWACRTMDAFFI